MYVKIKDVVHKCTERSEGERVFNAFDTCVTDCGCISLDFYDIVNVTEDFIFALLGSIAKQDAQAIIRIQYVRAHGHIKTKFKKAAKIVLDAK